MSNVPGQPVQIQLGVVPCYALTVHKTQALSIKHVAALASWTFTPLLYCCVHTVPTQKLRARDTLGRAWLSRGRVRAGPNLRTDKFHPQHCHNAQRKHWLRVLSFRSKRAA